MTANIKKVTYITSLLLLSLVSVVVLMKWASGDETKYAVGAIAAAVVFLLSYKYFQDISGVILGLCIISILMGVSSGSTPFQATILVMTLAGALLFVGVLLAWVESIMEIIKS